MQLVSYFSPPKTVTTSFIVCVCGMTSVQRHYFRFLPSLFHTCSLTLNTHTTYQPSCSFTHYKNDPREHTQNHGALKHNNTHTFSPSPLIATLTSLTRILDTAHTKACLAIPTKN